jgi:hypothetical protein
VTIKDPPGPNVSGTVKKLLGNRDFDKVLPAGKMGQEMGRMLAELAVDIQDYIDKAKFYQVRFEALKGEIKTLAAIVMSKQSGGYSSKIVLRKSELDAIPEDLEVHIETPEPGVRVYSMRKVPKDAGAEVRRILNG